MGLIILIKQQIFAVMENIKYALVIGGNEFNDSESIYNKIKKEGFIKKS